MTMTCIIVGRVDRCNKGTEFEYVTLAFWETMFI